MQNTASLVVVLGTGGTIAGTSTSAGDHVGYHAAQLGADQLIHGLGGQVGGPVEVVQVDQIDSKDMGAALWHRLAPAVQLQLQRPGVAGVVITHGTDTLEETAYFLQRVLAPSRPVVLVGAMRPASALQGDGPQNLVDAFVLAREPSARGVLTVLAGTVHSGLEVRKVHPYRLDAFSAGDRGPLARIEQGRLRQLRAWPDGQALGLSRLPAGTDPWPWVEIVTSHADARAGGVQALVARGVRGLIVAGTGNGTVHQALEEALLQAQAAGVRVWRVSRCLDGTVIDAGTPALPSAGSLTPVQARIEMALQLMPPAMPPAGG